MTSEAKGGVASVIMYRTPSICNSLYLAVVCSGYTHIIPTCVHVLEYLDDGASISQSCKMQKALSIRSPFPLGPGEAHREASKEHL